ncbi:hypothetical protein [Paracidovorax oryzae]|uniref:hypothetical protein n=1 Tax=Paracidovorax oryzae TaxID=862720 RepID=UPI000497FE7B|nr:hypothetical protein [Paracidovorax oryzae]
MAAPRMSRAAALLLAAAPIVALAVIVSAAEIIASIERSPNASPWLRQNAAAVANLAINVESNGETTAFNGSCCYGVLQMNQGNITRYAGVTPEEYRRQSLQQQVDAWSALTTDALQSRVVQDLLALGSFDGRPVDGSLVLACVQLGIGNCRTMLRAGRCSGFADSNGTTICGMADRIASGTAGGTPTAPGGGGGSGSGSGGGSGWQPAFGSCVRDAGGACVPVAESIQRGFARGSGQQMASVKTVSIAVAVAACFLVVGYVVMGVLQRFGAGQISLVDLKRYTMVAGLTLTLVLVALMII